jgi:GTP-binding protein
MKSPYTDPTSPTRFVASATDPAGLPITGLPEIGFLGRSNVGKSSLLGMVLGHPKLVRTSRTPGRTQALNLFVLENRLAFVDLPGYGFASLPKRQRAELDRLIRGYLTRRETLSGVVLMVDARRDDVSPLDRQMAAFVQEAGRPLLVAVTKADLVGKNKITGVVRRIEQGLGVPAGVALPCSAHEGEGKTELLNSLFEMRA